MKFLLAMLCCLAAMLTPTLAEAGDCSAFFGCQQAIVQQQHVQAIAVPQYQIQQPVILRQRVHDVQQPVIIRQQVRHHAVQRVRGQRVQAVRAPRVQIRTGLFGRVRQVNIR